MKRFLAIFTAVIALSASSLYGQTVKKTFNLGDFDGIDAGFVHNIHITKGSSNTIEVTCPERFVEYLDYKIINGILYLNVNNPEKKWKLFSNNGLNAKDGEEIVVNLQMDEITSIDLSGAAEITATGTYSTSRDFKLDLSGASEINETLNVNASNFSFDLSGSSDGRVQGEFKKIWGDVSGASELELIANSKTTLNIDASGSSEVTLSGSTNTITIDCSGASEVDAEKMIAENAKATASGSSHIKVFGNNTLELSTSGAATIKYYGEARDLRISKPSITKGN